MTIFKYGANLLHMTQRLEAVLGVKFTEAKLEGFASAVEAGIEGSGDYGWSLQRSDARVGILYIPRRRVWVMMVWTDLGCVSIFPMMLRDSSRPYTEAEARADLLRRTERSTWACNRRLGEVSTETQNGDQNHDDEIHHFETA